MKILLISLIILNFSLQNTFADNNSQWCMWNQSYSKYDSESCSFKNWFELYECRVKNICNPCLKVKNPESWNLENYQKLFQSENYKKAEDYRDETLLWDKITAPFEEIKSLYRENMNSIYQCALLDAQERWLKTAKDKLLKVDTTWKIKTNVEQRINSLENKLEAKKNALNCKWWWNNNSAWLFKKDVVLNETTYELCKYSFYLDYLKWYYSNVENISWITKKDQELMWTWTQSMVIKKIWEDFWNIQSMINNEINHTYKIFPLAFNAYNEYENNFQIHFILTIIREDYIVVRDLLAKVLWPINQLVYKIKDCMSLN